MKIAVDQEKCIGAGNCVLTDPEVFDQREEDGVVELLQDTPDAGHESAARDAAAICPAAAITIIEGQ